MSQVVDFAVAGDVADHVRWDVYRRSMRRVGCLTEAVFCFVALTISGLK
jgi:hypothetical protein